MAATEPLLKHWRQVWASRQLQEVEDPVPSSCVSWPGCEPRAALVRMMSEPSPKPAHTLGTLRAWLGCQPRCDLGVWRVLLFAFPCPLELPGAPRVRTLKQKHSLGKLSLEYQPQTS